MCLPKVATQWNSGATRDSNRGRRVLIPSALTRDVNKATVDSKNRCLI